MEQEQPEKKIENVEGAGEPGESSEGAPVEKQSAPVEQQPPSVSAGGPDDEAALEEEVQAALGDFSLLDMYGPDEDEKVQAAAPFAPQSPVSGVCRGRVISINGNDIFVDLGGKSQGLLPRDELEEGETIEVGAEVDVAIARYDGRDGLLILSKKTAEQRLLRDNLQEGSLVEGRVTGTNKGGLELDIKGLKAFMPVSQIDLLRVDDLEQFIGETFVSQVIQVDHDDKNIVLSRRRVLEKEQQEQREQMWAELEKGQTHHAVVRSLMDYGAFVDLGGIDALLHISEISWARVKHPNEILQVGQSIDVVVTNVDREKERIAVSLRQAGGDPWAVAEQRYPVGTRHQAQVKQLAGFGAFAELEPGVEGLIPISEMAWMGRIRHPSDVVEPGAMVEVEILSVDLEKRRISLSMKSLQANPWAGVGERYVKDHVYTGTVSQVTDFGAFVTLEPGIDGLVHISELADKRVAKTSDVVSKGEEVSVKVVSVDDENQRISLSMKGLSGELEGEADKASEPAGAAEPAKKKKGRPRRGGLDW